MGPGQYPQYTRAPFGEEAVGSSQYDHHRAPQAHNTVSPHTPHETVKSRTFTFLIF